MSAIGLKYAQCKDTSAVGDRFGAELVKLLPLLRRYAFSLCGDGVQAQDLAQEAATRGWMARQSFQQGTSLKAWLVTIMRNYHYSQFRMRRRESPLGDHDVPLPGEASALASIELAAVGRAMTRLPSDHREALIAVAEGHSYAEMAEILHCPVGTAKSRVSRSRVALRHAMETPVGRKIPNRSMEQA